MNKNLALVLFALFAINSIFAQENKEPLTHDVYSDWKNIRNQQISNDGLWVTYQIKPQKGDGFLYLYNTETGITDSIARGVKASIAPSSDFMVFKIVPQYDSLRKLKLAKTSKKKLPKDSLGIWYFAGDSIIKIAKVKSYSITDRGESWISYINQEEKKKELEKEKKGWWIFGKNKKTTIKKPIKQKGDNIILLNPKTNLSYKFDKADNWRFDYNGSAFFVETITKQDSTNNTSLIRYDLAKDKFDTIINKTGTGGKYGISRDGMQAALLFAQDTAKKNKVFDLYYWNKGKEITVIADTSSTSIPNGYSPSNNYTPHFSKDANKLYFGTSIKPTQEIEDTLLAEEKYHVDIWNHKDKLLQPQQKLQAKREKKRTYLAQYDIKSKKILQLADSLIRHISLARSDASHFALGIDNITFAQEQSWDGWYSNYYIINTHDGSKEVILEHFQGSIRISPNGNYVIYFKDKAWYSYDIEARKHINLTNKLVVNFYNEEHDTPNEARAYGMEGWYTNEKYFLVSDRYDIWKLDPTGKQKPENITKAYGRINKIRFSEITFDRELHEFFNEENPHLLRGFSESDKSEGYYSLLLNDKSEPKKLIQSAHNYYSPVKAKNSNQLIFRRSSFTEYPELNITTIDFKEIKKISNTNPQQKDYNWGTVELTKWTAFDGQELEGLIYKPENFDSTKLYPMIVYFYERYSNDLHNHYIPKPSHSVINFTEYISNGYIIFIPDITYKTGHPAKSAYNAIVSGTEFMKKNSWIDGTKIGMQGQSWGGYQTAMLVTMTDIYACAESGAPVSNMTSAYGGIRWSTGMSRTFQYEKTQSRIGTTLWDSLDLYIENSPIFHADKVNTPILIMHNDKDGAVPWYQGIEYFVALRRLNKEAWMLTYNNDGHNLMKWPNRTDLSIRMMQFFDHYLKEKPMPEWMDKGLPAVDKGKKNAY
ncbi:MAG: S9 family peptidase [Bacteroidales bacterium]|nr:S9 family peptidase [Bacteroidales bacterium]